MRMGLLSELKFLAICCDGVSSPVEGVDDADKKDEVEQEEDASSMLPNSAVVKA